MIKEFCDCCGVEITDTNRQCSGSDANPRIACEKKGKHGTIAVEVQVAVNGTWNGGAVCKYCVIDTVKLADDRPTPEQWMLP